MKKIRVKVNKFIEGFLVLILGGMVINVIWQVFTRFFTSNPSAFTNELAPVSYTHLTLPTKA